MRIHLKNYRSTIAACSTLLALLPAFAQTPPAAPGLAANPVFQKECAKCHGKTAEGRHFAGPPLLSEKAASASADDLHNIIANGKNHMPKFSGKLTPEEIDALVQQIQALNKK